MTRKRKPYKTYTKEFKLEALRLTGESDRPASEIAMQLNKKGSVKNEKHMSPTPFCSTKTRRSTRLFQRKQHS